MVPRSSPQILMVPGYTNSGPQHWQSLWQQTHPEYRRVEQEDWNTPDVTAWVRALDREIRATEAPVILVAHSLGCMTIAHWNAQTSNATAYVRAALLVAPADVERPDAPAVLRLFGPVPLRTLPFRSLTVASTTDETVSLERAIVFATAWGAELVTIGDAGHINTAAGFGPWPAGERLLDRLIQQIQDATPAVEIRLATDADLDAILALIRACIDHMRADGIDQWDDLYPTRETFRQDLLDGTLWVATVNGVCQGVMVLNEHQDPEYDAVTWQYRDGAVLVVHRLAVNPTVEGQGIASQLMQGAETYAQTHGYTAIRLDAFGANPRACALYQRRGYRVAGHVRFRKGEFVVFERCVSNVRQHDGVSA